MSGPSVVDKVVRLLGQRKPALAVMFQESFSCKADTDEQQIKALNNHFRVVLGRLEINTTQERSVLRDELSAETWLRYFENYVIPTLVRFTVEEE